MLLSRLLKVVASLSLCAHLMAVRPACAAEGQSKDRSLQHMDLVDFRGKQWSLNEFADKPVIVIAFLGVECPLAKLYATRLNELQQQFAPRQVAVIGVDANPQDALNEMAAFARRQELTYPWLRDSQQDVATQLGATRTPEVFVLDQQRRVRYQGRIDDQYGIGYARQAPETHFLREAIESLLAGREVQVASQPAVGCLIGKVKVAPTSNDITYSKHIAPIFRDACVQCHRAGEVGPFPMTEYAEISGWAEMIAEVVAEKRMPPWHANPEFGSFANDCSLSDQQRDLVLKWVAAGAPEGDPADLPEPRKFVDGWQLPKEPDLVLNASPKPVDVPATGEVKYMYFPIDPHFTEDKWVSAAQIVPGNRSVVHHVLVFARRKDDLKGLAGERGFLFGYVPGAVPQAYPAGIAKRIPAGSILVFQIHYTPTGTPQTDHSKLGLVFVDAAEVQREVKTTSAVQTRLDIPPGDADYAVRNVRSERLPDCELLGLAPHMHLRGKSFKYTLLAANKSPEVILDVPHYDFNWQTAYRLAQPLKVAAGTTISCDASFDNSPKNFNNPDPTARVHWGDQTDDEMMIGYFDILVPKENENADRAQEKDRRAIVRFIINNNIVKKYDKNNDGLLQRAEIRQDWQNQFDLLDQNQDGVINSEELKETN